jgi:hypothetical protein
MIISTYLYYGFPTRREAGTMAEAEAFAQAYARVSRTVDNARGADFQVPPYQGRGRSYQDRDHHARHRGKKSA